MKVCDPSKEEGFSLVKSLRQKHTNLCTCVKFRPNHPREVISGALDSSIVVWDFVRGKSLFSFVLHQQGSQQVVNPPFVHSIDLSPNGKTLAAGLGDSTVALFDLDKRHQISTLESHSASVVQVLFPLFEPREHIISASNDTSILLWHLKYLHSTPKTTNARNGTVSLQINHGSKINWLSSTENGQLFVADVSAQISVYQMDISNSLRS